MISGASANVSLARAAPAGAARRLLAATIDWFICIGVPLAAAAVYVSVVWLAILPLSVVCYFAFFLARGRTPGMRAAATHVVDGRTGSSPGTGKALFRALAALLQAAAFFALSNVVLSDRPEGGYSVADVAVFTASCVIAASALLAHLWMFVDRRRETLLDRIFWLELRR